MRLAITYKDGKIFPHFGKTEQFKIYDIENDNIISSEVVSADGYSHGGLAIFLKQQDVDVLICGGIGPGAIQMLEQAAVIVYAGVDMTPDEAARALLNHTLEYSRDATCSHKDA